MNDRPTREQLKRHFRYDPVTGKLYWRNRPDTDFSDGPVYPAKRIAAMWRSKFSGKAFGAVDDKGYIRGWYCGRFYRAHQIVWAMHHDEWPPQLDHKSGERHNNRIGNLRRATNRINSQNRQRRSNNRSGATGVHANNGKWVAKIGSEYLGRFATIDAAIAVRKIAERRLGYHPNHGRK